MYFYARKGKVKLLVSQYYKTIESGASIGNNYKTMEGKR